MFSKLFAFRLLRSSSTVSNQRSATLLLLARQSRNNSQTSSVSEIGVHSIAVLIDGDNAESTLLGEFVAEAGRHGKVTVKRVYADWTSPQVCAIAIPPFPTLYPISNTLLTSR